MAIPSEQALIASQEFRDLPLPVQQAALAKYREQYTRPAASQEDLGGAPVAGQLDLDQEEMPPTAAPKRAGPVYPTPGATASGGKAPAPPVSWKELTAAPWFEKLPTAKKELVKRMYYEQFEAPAGVAPDESQTAPGIWERGLGGVRGVIGSFQKTIGLWADQPEWVKAGEENTRVSAETSYQMPNPQEGWGQVRNLASLPFYKQVLTHYLPAAMPYIAGAAVGGKLGAIAGAAVAAPTAEAAAPVTIPAGAILGAMIGLFGVGFTQVFGDAHQEYLDKHPKDFDGANTYAFKQAGISGAVAVAAEPLALVGGGAAIPGIARGLAGAAVTVSKEAALTPIKRALGQLIIQSTTGIGGQVVGNAIRKDVDPDVSLSQGLAEAGLSQLAYALPGIVRASRVARGSLVHSLGAAEEAAHAAGVDKGPEGGILDKTTWDPSTGMEIPPHGYYPEKTGPVIDPSTGIEIPAGKDIPGAEDWRRTSFEQPREAPKIDQGLAETVGRPYQRPQPVPQEAARASVPGEVEIDPSAGAEIPIGGTVIDPSTGMEIPPYGMRVDQFRQPRESAPERVEPREVTQEPIAGPKSITPLMKARLESEGYSVAEIAKMTPADAFEIIRSREEERRAPAELPDVPESPGEAVPPTPAKTPRRIRAPKESAEPEPSLTPVKGAATPEAGATAEAQRPTTLKERIAARKVPRGASESPYDITDYLMRLEEKRPGTIERYLAAQQRQREPGPLAPEPEAETGLRKGEEEILTQGTPAEKAALATVAGSRRRIQRSARQSLAPTGGEPGTLDALQARASSMLPNRVRVAVADRLANGASGEADIGASLIKVAHDALDKNALIDHEVWHHAKEMLSPLERTVIEGKFREGGKWHQRVEKLLSGAAYERARQQLGTGDEREAYGFQLYRQGKLKADTAIGRIFDKLSGYFERIRNWVAGSGFKSAEDVFRAVSSGELRNRAAGAGAPDLGQARQSLKSFGMRREEGAIFLHDGASGDLILGNLGEAHGDVLWRAIGRRDQENFWRGEYGRVTNEVDVHPPNDLFGTRRLRIPDDLLTQISREFPGAKINLKNSPDQPIGGRLLSLGPTASQRRETFRQRVEPASETAQEKIESIAKSLKEDRPADEYTTGINTSKLNFDENRKNRLSQEIAQKFPEYQAKKRGTRSWNEDYAAGEKLIRESTAKRPDGTTLKGPSAYLYKLLTEPGRKATTGPEMAARLMVEDAHAEHITGNVDLATGTLTQRADFNWMLTQHQILQAKVAGSATESGRVLNLMKSREQMQKLRGIALEKAIAESQKGRISDLEMADTIRLLNDPDKIKSYLQDAYKPKWWHYPMEVRMNALLSNPGILWKKTVTDGILRAIAGPEDVVASLFGRLRGDADRAYATDALARWRGVVSSSIDSFRVAKEMWRTGESNFETRQIRHAIPGKAGEFVRTPSRAIEFVNEFARAQAYTQEVQALANRTALREGLKGDAYWARYNELVAHPTEAIRMKAFEAGQYRTAQAQLGEFGKRFQGLVNSNPIAKTIFPFVKTPINLIKLGAERSPAALLMPEFWKAYRGGGIARDYALAKLSMGTAATVALASLAHQGYITGDGPTDPGEMAVKRRTGPVGGERWQPRSLLIGDRYYQYGSIEPLGVLLGTIASYVELKDHMEGQEPDKIAAAIVGSIFKTIATRTYMSGLTDVIAAMADPERHGGSFIGRLVASAVPSGVAQVNRMIDPQLRETQGILDQVRARIPGLAQTMPVRRDVAGEPIELGDTFGNIPFFPVFTSHQAADEVANRLEQVGAKLRPVERRINKWDLTAEQHSEYQQLVGERLWPMLDRVTSQESFDNRSQDSQLRIIRRVEEMAHKIATLQMKREYPELRRPKTKEAS